MDDTKKLLDEYRKEIEALKATVRQLTGEEDPEPVPIAPLSERPCSLCGDLHDPNAPVVTCICLSCGEKRPLVHCGNCSNCTYKALGMSMGYEVAAQAVPDPGRPKMPWEES